MFNRLYITMALYFLGIIATTLLAVTLLVFFTVGRPLARDIHTMLRSHTTYLAGLVNEAGHPETNFDEINRSFERFSGAYGFNVALFDRHRRVLAGATPLNSTPSYLSEQMFETSDREGIFVQSSHFGRPLVYMLPLDLTGGGHAYLYMTKAFPADNTILVFLSGLAILGFLLTLAVYPLSKSITRPITRLTRDLGKIAAGHFDQVPDSRRKDEIGSLVRGYRAMSESVNHMIQSKKQLLADMSHELCSPLARIRVGTELLRSANQGGKWDKYLGNIEHDIESMDRLIGNLARFSTMNLPGYALERQPLAPGNLVDAILSLYQPTADLSSILLIRSLPGNLPRINGDVEQLKQVFSNLMDNALRYSEAGGEIRLGAEHVSDRVCFFVEDQGPGVPESDREKIFDPLYRVDFSRNRTLGGAGLGLALSRKIMELHGGSLDYSRENGHTRFTFCIDIYL